MVVRLFPLEMSFVQKFGFSVIDDSIVNDGERVSYLIRFSS